MKKIILALVISLALASCKKTSNELLHVCNCQQQAAASVFVKESISDANNMSDEEMEDVISQLERTAVRLNCSQKYVSVTRVDGLLQSINDANPNETIYPY